MPKNKGKGGKNRKKGKSDGAVTKRELVFKDPDQEYGIVTKLLGNCNMNVECADGQKRIAHVRGAMRKRVWVKVQDTILLSLRDFQDGKADIILVYDNDEVRMLRSYGELPENWGNDDDDIISDLIVKEDDDDVDDDVDNVSTGDIDIDDI